MSNGLTEEDLKKKKKFGLTGQQVGKEGSAYPAVDYAKQTGKPDFSSAGSDQAELEKRFTKKPEAPSKESKAVAANRTKAESARRKRKWYTKSEGVRAFLGV